MTGNSVHGARGNSVHNEHWNRLPDSALYDRRLSLAGRCVYAVLARAVHQGTVAKMGQRRISKLFGIHQETVALALRDLAARGHLTISGSGNRRRTYHLISFERIGRCFRAERPARRFGGFAIRRNRFKGSQVVLDERNGGFDILKPRLS